MLGLIHFQNHEQLQLGSPIMSINTQGLSNQQIKIIEDLVTQFRTNSIDELISPISTPIDHEDLVESAELYAEIYREDQELQALTEVALME